MAPRYVDIYKPEYTVLCGCHVRKVALFIAYVSLIIAVIGIIGPLVNHQWYYALSAIILIFSCVFIIIADAKAKPRFYLAYLIVTGIYVVIKLLEILLYIVIFCKPDIIGSKDPDSEFLTKICIFERVIN
uniref:Uncharacterized protein n=1 Tax=Panagrolaimus sp. JU765 TaxID=591449 RepID=A0AC34RLW8_9BILA